MMARNKKKWLAAGAAVLGAAIAFATAGCQNDKRRRVVHGEMFPRDEAVRPVDRFIDVQAAAAARADGTLNAYHFDAGGDLNTLGRTKLDKMLFDDDSGSRVVVYLDIRDQLGTPGRHREAVRSYLADRGVTERQLDLRTGTNPDHVRPARDGLRGLKRLQGEAEGTPAPDGAAGPGTPSALSDILGKSGGK